jgi:hypothetical protein
MIFSLMKERKRNNLEMDQLMRNKNIYGIEVDNFLQSQGNGNREKQKKRKVFHSV